jgi:hypothetical protein
VSATHRPDEQPDALEDVAIGEKTQIQFSIDH